MTEAGAPAMSFVIEAAPPARSSRHSSFDRVDPVELPAVVEVHEHAVVAAPLKFMSKVPKAEDEQRLIIATCEKGTVENIDEMRQIKGNLDKVKKENPNFVEIAAKAAFRDWRRSRPATVRTHNALLPSRSTFRCHLAIAG